MSSEKTSTGGRIVYEIRNTAGEVVARHVRIDQPNDEKKVWWERPDGTPGLNGTKLADLPLYGAHVAHEWADDDLIILAEGEKAREALDGAGYNAVGTVCGASSTPGSQALEVLRDVRVVLWPDHDDAGRQHMDRIASRLHGVAAEVLVYEWHDAPEHGDAADHPAIQSRNSKGIDRLWTALEDAPRWKPQAPEGLAGRVLLGELLRGGIEPTPQLIEGLLYEGRIHSIASGPGTGKTLLAEWMAIQIMNQGRPVLYIDAENGPKLVAERLEELGADLDALDDLFHYYPAEVALDRESLTRLMVTVEQAEPALVVFDSFADLLSIAGLEENSNDDCTRWMRLVAQPVKDADVAVLVLDHVPKNGKGPRGGGSKRAKVDVQWNLDVTQSFDRERTGEIELKHDKDRECWLPKIVRFSVGGGVFARSHGTIEEPDPETHMTANAGKVFDYLRKQGKEGARWSDLLVVLEGSKGALTRALRELQVVPLIEKRQQRYYLLEVVPVNPIDKPNMEGTTRYQKGTTVPPGTGESEKVPGGTTPRRGGTPVPDAVPVEKQGDDLLQETPGHDASCLCDECVPL